MYIYIGREGHISIHMKLHSLRISYIYIYTYIHSMAVRSGAVTVVHYPQNSFRARISIRVFCSRTYCWFLRSARRTPPPKQRPLASQWFLGLFGVSWFLGCERLLRICMLYICMYIYIYINTCMLYKHLNREQTLTASHCEATAMPNLHYVYIFCPYGILLYYLSPYGVTSCFILTNVIRSYHMILYCIVSCHTYQISIVLYYIRYNYNTVYYSVLQAVMRHCNIISCRDLVMWHSFPLCDAILSQTIPYDIIHIIAQYHIASN